MKNRTQKRLEKQAGPELRFVDLELDRDMSIMAERSGVDEVVTDKRNYDHCAGDWPQCEGEWFSRLKALIDDGYRVVNNDPPELRVLQSVEQYGDLVVLWQELSLAGKENKEIYATAKERFGFKSKKEMTVERMAWIDYLFGEPELHAEVDRRQLALLK